MTVGTPELTFYYKINDPTTKFNNITVGTNILQTVNGILYQDRNFLVPIGKFAFNVIIFDAESDKDLYQGTGSNVYFLSKGTLSHSLNVEFIKDNRGVFVLPTQKITYQILSGSNKYQNLRGIITQQSFNDAVKSRMIQVYLEKIVNFFNE